MSIITLDQAKEHLRVDFHDEDSLIQLYLNGAEISVQNYLGRALYATTAGTDTTGLVINDAVTAAVLLQVGSMYENREPTDKRTVLPDSMKWLLNPYRLGMGV
jgi:uncharacterized phage protein (predicted DNA packaging)